MDAMYYKLMNLVKYTFSAWYVTTDIFEGFLPSFYETTLQ